MASTASKPEKQTVFIASAIMDAWGGSEELWVKSVPYLQCAGFKIVVCKHHIHREHRRIAALIDEGVTFLSTAPAKPFLVRLYWKIGNKIRSWVGVKGDPTKPPFYYSYDSITLDRKSTRLNSSH